MLATVTEILLKCVKCQKINQSKPKDRRIEPISCRKVLSSEDVLAVKRIRKTDTIRVQFVLVHIYVCRCSLLNANGFVLMYHCTRGAIRCVFMRIYHLHECPKMNKPGQSMNNKRIYHSYMNF